MEQWVSDTGGQAVQNLVPKNRANPTEDGLEPRGADDLGSESLEGEYGN